MKKRFITAVCAICVIALLLPVFCFAEETDRQTVTVGYFDLEDFMMGASEDTPKTGYAYDLLCEIAAVNGWRYRFVYGSFSELLDQLYEGKIDLLPCIVYTEERAENFIFSEMAINEEKYYLSALTEKAKDISPNDTEILNNSRISTVKDAYQNVILEKWLAEKNIKAELITSDNFNESWDVLSRGEADFVLNIDNSAPNTGFTTIFEVGRCTSHFVTGPGKESLMDGINYALETVQQINPFLLTHLQEKYLSQALSSYQLSDGEKEWIANHPVIRIGALDTDVPYSYYGEDGKVTGVFKDMVGDILNSLNIDSKVEWKLYDTADDLRGALNAGEIEAFCPEYRDHYLAQTNGMLISEYITKVSMGMLKSPGQNAADVKTVAVPETRHEIYYVKDNFEDINIVGCDSVHDCIEAVRNGKADAAISNEAALHEELKFDSGEYEIQTLKSLCEICFCAKADDNEFIMIVNRGLHLISDSEIEALELMYTPAAEYTFRDFLRGNMVSIIIAGAFLVLLIVFLIERILASGKLKKNLVEISRQKELIEQKEEELIEAKDSANAANSAKTVFLFNMSHDIRTPMNAIIGYTAIARKYCSDQPQVKDYLDKIDIAGNNLLSIVNQVLEMARIEAGRIELNRDKVDLIENFTIQRTIVESNASSHGITLECSHGEISDPWVITDTGRLNQVITNILGNAIKYTREGGRVVYTLRQTKTEGDRAEFEFKVSDNGIGMTKEFVEHVFDQFSRERNSTVSGIQGTGLGMSIVKRIVAIMDGDITVESEPNVGTTVTVLLPMEICAEEIRPAEEEMTESVDFIGRRVLLVEDNEMNREIACDLLTDCGFEVDEAEDGVVAVEKVKASADNYYDFVLMDIQMPNMDGYEATGAIRKLDDPKLASVPIIALSANAFEEDRQKSIAAGMNDHVAKPIDINTLFASIAKFIK